VFKKNNLLPTYFLLNLSGLFEEKKQTII